jgi:hypothetical protein
MGLEKNNQSSSAEIHPDLLAAFLIYSTSGLISSKFLEEAESKKYGASSFEMNHQRIKFRVGKITPTKKGQFVTLWKRIGNRPIQPYDIADPVDLFVVSVRAAQRFGQFVFPKAILCEKGVVSKQGQEGKRAMRVYPPWDIADNQQSKKTQAWQLLYFFEISPNTPVDITRVQRLFL